MNKRIYAKTIEPENTFINVEDYFDLEEMGVCIGGNNDFKELNYDPVLDADRLCNDLYFGYANDGSFYGKANGRRFTDEEFAKLTKIAKDPNMGWNETVEAFTLAYLELYYGKEGYRRVMLKGYCQGDWVEAYAPKEVSDELLDELECYCFNMGTEVIIDYTDREDVGPNDIEGYSAYFPTTDEHELRERVAQTEGASSEDVVLYVFDGYRRIPTYKTI